MYRLQCVACAYSWQSYSADISECPMCDSKDIVVVEKKEGEV